MDFSAYRLTDTSELDKFKVEMGEKEFYDYAISIYKYFAGMERDETFSIAKQVARKNTEKFIKVMCLYMIDFPGHLQINNTFTELFRL